MILSKLIDERIRQAKARLLGERVAPRLPDEAPLRSELFGIHQLELHARSLAGWHKIALRPGSDRLLSRLAENENFLLQTYHMISSAIKSNRQITPAVEWLVDNFYLIEEQIRTARRHFPKGYSRELPYLSNGPSAGFPRVYDLVQELISHVDGKIDAENISCFTRAYQSGVVLSIGELWAIPIMLRLALIENLRRVAVGIAQGRRDRDEANLWADRMIETAEKDPKSLVLVLADMARSNPPMSSAFVAELARCLQGQSPSMALSLAWVEQRLSEDAATIEQRVQEENQTQAADQVSIGNSINSFRFLGAMDWREFVESLSAVEQILRQDPADIYGQMDFNTRDRYRHVIESLARKSVFSQEEVARKAIELSRNKSDPRERHVGFYLVDKGLPRLERAVKMRFSLPKVTNRIGRRFAFFFYLSAVAIVTLSVGGWILAMAHFHGMSFTGLILLSVPMVFAASHFAVAWINRLSLMMVQPVILPRMDFAKHVPPEFSTLVVVPTILPDGQTIDRLLEGLEVRYLANREENFYFALLSDFPDADLENMPGDPELLERASVGIQALNEKYADGGPGVFYFFHRPRLWNDLEKVWMGQERKRGKLGDLNLLLRTGNPDRFSLAIGVLSALAKIKYVITLDTDTQLLRDSARHLVETMAHPLNRPKYDPRQKVVVEGYGLLQPRVEITLPSYSQSRFAGLFGGEPGIDPYTRAVSDLYQDLFGEGSFIGKGIYDVQTFDELLTGQFPNDRILSHDLLEGCYVRSALVSDVQMTEDYPSNYLADTQRRHRWIRGDWQIASWMLPWVPGPANHRQWNPISLLSRWKIFDNLRRSLVAPSLLFLLFFGWIVGPSPVFWTWVVLAILFLSPVLNLVLELFQRSKEVPWNLHVRTTVLSLGRQIGQNLFALTLLPFEAYRSVDAIVRTWIRIHLTHRNLLEWQTFHETNCKLRSSLGNFLRSMWVAPAAGLLWAGYFWYRNPDVLIITGPICGLWCFSFLIAWWISLPPGPEKMVLSKHQTRFLRKLARTTWRYFETFMGPEDHWLIPDNFQEKPNPVIAHRTSPTNIGLGLLSHLAAYDFGYLSAGALLDRTQKTMQTLTRLEKYRGHLYNWYDTHSLRPLAPHYVSTVDSGNFASYLLILRTGLMSLSQEKIFPTRGFEGIQDTLYVLLEQAKSLKDLPAGVSELLGEMLRSDGQVPPTLSELYNRCRLLTDLARDLELHTASRPDDEFHWWVKALTRQCLDFLAELALFAPWIPFLPEAGSFRQKLSVAAEEQHGNIQSLFEILDRIPTLGNVAGLSLIAGPTIGKIQSYVSSHSSNFTPQETAWLRLLVGQIAESSNQSVNRLRIVEELSLQCGELSEPDYDFLYDRSQKLLAIGYHVHDRRREVSYYDLLGSESRLGSFVGIAQGQLPQEHWFALGRLLTVWKGRQILLSWSGSMFEYLMPLVLMPTYPYTLLNQTCKAVVDRQIEYGQRLGVPWGISESGYNLTDVHLNYQYQAFGVPGLGFKRGLGDSLVIAPYASALALMVAPNEACRNLERMARDGYCGRYGFYEAVDFTPSRIPRGKSHAVVQSYMAHHEGMSFLSLAYSLLNRPMQKRFKSEPMFQATELLLHERVPKSYPFLPHATELPTVERTASERKDLMRVFSTPQTTIPEVHLLSNGRYSVMITNSGSGYSRWNNTAITRWGEDTTLDNSGTFCYLRDVGGSEVWSMGYQPTLRMAKNYEAIFSQGRAEFRRRDHELDLHAEIAVSPEDDIELRRINLTNYSRSSRTIELTSYAQIDMTERGAALEHPAFHNLFVQTEIVPEQQAILCTRRPRSPGEHSVWMFHMITSYPPTNDGGAELKEISFETDRAKFIGRGKTPAQPQAMETQGDLSNTDGSVLDPIAALRGRITLRPGETGRMDLITGVAETREAALKIISKYHDHRLADRVFELSWTHGQVVLNQFNAQESDAQIYGRLAGSILYSSSLRRAGSSVLIKNRRGQTNLWSMGISGDYPIVLLRISDQSRMELVRRLVQAHAYWRLKGLAVDLVILNEDYSGYRQLLQDQIMGLITAGTESHTIDRPAGIFVRRGDQMSDEDQILLQTVSRIVLTSGGGTLEEQIERRGRIEPKIPRFKPTGSRSEEPADHVALANRDLDFFNGRGGFTRDGREYITRLSPGQTTPAPWVNVLANPIFGTVVSESGAGYTWLENAHEFRLTPWHNDPVCDTSGEAFYLRDEETGRFWSPSPLPARGKKPYCTRHGFGYSVFEYTETGIRSEMWMYVSTDLPVKFVVIKIQNLSGRPRRFSATGYMELVLGRLRHQTSMYVNTEVDPKTGAMFARNPYHTEFSDRVVFFDVNEPLHSVTGDRMEFLGRNGTYGNPAAMYQTRLSGKVGAGMDPCCAMQVQFDLAEGQEDQVVFTLGAGRNTEEAQNLVQRIRGSDPARQELEKVWGYWSHTLGTVYLETPDPTINILSNGWLLYQTISSRLWGRSGFYQSGGAFGFRDQLQDAMALIHSDPHLLREHLLRSAAHQFKEGDVLHWWHEPSGRGVRSRISDDFLWLPLAVCRYVECIGDTGVLEEQIPFLQGRPIRPEEEAYYDLPLRSEETGTLYEHCVRAILHGLQFGAHGLPLMGSGDWNDAMNLVGAQGKGESVWLGFFLYYVLQKFSLLALRREDKGFVERCQNEMARLRDNIEKNGWDGDWYLRAYLDDGTPLGSKTNPECQIDSIPQSWSALSGAVDRLQAKRALEEVYQRLVVRESSLIRLLTPPFDKSSLNPGYIKGYVPGVRENGGQYTHAAIWVVMAFAALKDNRRAWELMSMINPIRHGSTPDQIMTYKVEPYVAAADVYAASPHVGRGGWTWYTGSAGWMYRLIIESLLGLILDVDRLRFEPCLPDDWKTFKMHYRYRETFYHITFIHGGANTVTRVTVDGVDQPDKTILLSDDRQEHHVEVETNQIL